jgi:hypothetical protein
LYHHRWFLARLGFVAVGAGAGAGLIGDTLDLNFKTAEVDQQTNGIASGLT